MACIRKRSGRWQALIRRNGHKALAKTFSTFSDAQKWARLTESEIERSVYVSRSEAEHTLLRDVISRYRAEVTPKKRSARTESYTLSRLDHEFGFLSLAGLKPSHVAQFRDQRLAGGASPGTVIKDLNTLAHLIEVARRDWGCWISSNPARLITRPQAPAGRDRRLKPGEEDSLLSTCGRHQLTDMRDIVALALETAMRLGELLSLTWDDVDLATRTSLLPMTKNGRSRTVPLSARAVTILELRGPRSGERVFTRWSRPDSFENAWKRVLKRSGIVGLRFHDLRHEATSRLFEKGLNPIQVAAITGHQTLQMLNRYAHLRASDLAKLL